LKEQVAQLGADRRPRFLVDGCRRFAHVERGVAASGRQLGDVPLDDLEALWQEAKRET
jgi:uncharacterized protein YabN with tetrapyrrole methylase and pyrophosphatase domain